MKKIGETMLFSNGAEITPAVTVDRFYAEGSMHHLNTTFTIRQNGQTVQLSPETMRAILKWYQE
jgi:hypothetical protein